MCAQVADVTAALPGFQRKDLTRCYLLTSLLSLLDKCIGSEKLSNSEKVFQSIEYAYG